MDLRHIEYFRNVNPPPNMIPYGFILDGKIIWEEKNDYGLYVTSFVKGIMYQSE